MCPGIAKTGLIDISLHVRMWNCMVLQALALHRKLLEQKTNPKMQFGCIAHDLIHYSG